MKIDEPEKRSKDTLVKTVMDSKANGDSGPTTKEWLERFLHDLTSASAAKQLTVGGITGWCAGFAFSKVGKVAATAIGGGLLLVQIAQHQGYIKVNWTSFNREVENAKRKLEFETQTKLPKILEEGQQFFQDNVYLATGFAGGFLLGMASS